VLDSSVHCYQLMVHLITHSNDNSSCKCSRVDHAKLFPKSVSPASLAPRSGIRLRGQCFRFFLFQSQSRVDHRKQMREVPKGEPRFLEHMCFELSQTQSMLENLFSRKFPLRALFASSPTGSRAFMFLGRKARGRRTDGNLFLVSFNKHEALNVSLLLILLA
jgi:hypothetical protein